MSRTVPLLDLSSLVFSMILQLRHSPPFPYTTLFRSFCSSGASSPAAYAPAKPSTSTIRPSSANRRFLPAGLAGGGGGASSSVDSAPPLAPLAPFAGGFTEASFWVAMPDYSSRRFPQRRGTGGGFRLN